MLSGPKKHLIAFTVGVTLLFCIFSMIASLGHGKLPSIDEARCVARALVAWKNAAHYYPPLTITDCKGDALYSWRIAISLYTDPIPPTSNQPDFDWKRSYLDAGMAGYIEAGRGKPFHLNQKVTRFVGLKLEGGAMEIRGPRPGCTLRKVSDLWQEGECRLLCIGVANYAHAWYEPGDCGLDLADDTVLAEVPEIGGDCLLVFDDGTIVFCRSDLTVAALKRIALSIDGLAECDKQDIARFVTIHRMP